jgi:Cu2+-exporting ATPase
MFVSFLLVGRWLELRVRHRAEAALEASSAHLPDTVLRERADGTVESVSARLLQPGDRMRVPVGQAFAADGLLAQGDTQVDEALLTGESRPIAKALGDAVVAGSMNLGAPVLMLVERAGADTRSEAIAALMRAARAQRPTLLAAADRWAAPFLWSVLALAAGAGVAWSFIDPARALGVVVAVLVVTCPCALSLAAPSALLSAAAAMARRGLLPARLDAIERLAQMRTLFVDKTGTLTEGKLVCTAVERIASPAGTPPGQAMTEAALRRVAASLAGWSSHPLAQALREGEGGDALVWHGLKEHPGLGLEGIDSEGRRWRLGEPAWAGLAGAALAAGRAGSADAQTCLARDGQPLARFVFDERLRDGAAEAVQALQADGVRVHLLSGDDPARAQRMGQRLALDAASGGLSPEAKLAVVQAAQARGEVVGMLGDGINDAPVLARADVSIAMGEGALIARTQADAVLLSMRLTDIVRARTLARRTLRVVRQNFVWAALYNAACVPLALAGLLPPWAAGLGMAGSSLFVVFNSLRLSR